MNTSTLKQVISTKSDLGFSADKNISEYTQKKWNFYSDKEKCKKCQRTAYSNNQLWCSIFTFHILRSSTELHWWNKSFSQLYIWAFLFPFWRQAEMKRRKNNVDDDAGTCSFRCLSLYRRMNNKKMRVKHTALVKLFAWTKNKFSTE